MKAASAVIALTFLACGNGGGGGGQPCATATDCAAGEACVGGACTVPASCAAGATCPAGEACSTTGVCIPAGTCLGDGDCADADYCSANGTCIADGTCLTDGDCLAGMVCDATQACVPGGGCGASEVAITPIAPNLLIVLDRSCSMRSAVAGVPKWTSAVGAITTLTTNFADDVRWGLTMFPDTTGASCGQDAIAIPVAPGAAPAIQGLLAASLMTSDPNYPDGPCVTNIDSAMAQAATEPAFADAGRPSYAMLITDGSQSGCNLDGGNAGTVAILDGLAQQGIKTFVVGFGGGTNVTQMDMFAVAGGTALPTSPRFYKADDAAALEAAFGQIADLVIGCDFALANPPADLAELFAFFNNSESIPQDPTHTDGWDYDPATMTLTFYGSSCARLQDGSVTDVDIVYGCAGPTPD
ncbi:MAG: hypothetical protein R3B06_02080 [Kofleriaceae bacterium]